MKFGTVVARSCLIDGRLDGRLPPLIVLGGRYGHILLLVVALCLFFFVLIHPGEVVVHHDIETIVAIAHAEGVADARLHLQTVGKGLDGLLVCTQHHLASGVAHHHVAEREDVVLALVARRSILIAIVDIIHIHAEAGAGRQHEHVALLLALGDVVGDGDEILLAIDATEEGSFAIVLHLLCRWLSEDEEGGGRLFLQSAHLIIAEVLPYAVLDAH